MQKKWLKYSLIGLLGLTIGFGSAYIYYNNTNKNHKIENNTDTKNKEDANDESENFTRTYKITLNEKVKNLKVNFEIVTENNENILTGKLNGTDVQILETPIYKDDNINKIIDENLSKNNFKVIEGVDKEYLGIKESNHCDLANYENLHILNDELKEIENGNIELNWYAQTIELESNEKPWYKDQFNSNYHETQQIKIKIEDKKIYILERIPPKEFSTEDYGILEEKVYEISNNKLNYLKSINKWKIVNIVGAID